MPSIADLMCDFNVRHQLAVGQTHAACWLDGSIWTLALSLDLILTPTFNLASISALTPTLTLTLTLA